MKEKNEEETFEIPETIVVEYSKTSLIRSFIFISLSWLLLFTAYFSLVSLQSSINSDANLGTLSLSSTYIGLIIGSTFVPKLLHHFFSLKWSIVFSQIAYFIYILANIYPRWITLLPGNFIRFKDSY